MINTLSSFFRSVTVRRTTRDLHEQICATPLPAKAPQGDRREHHPRAAAGPGSGSGQGARCCAVGAGPGSKAVPVSQGPAGPERLRRHRGAPSPGQGAVPAAQDPQTEP